MTHVIGRIEPLNHNQQAVLQPSIGRDRHLLESHPEHPEQCNCRDYHRSSDVGLVARVTKHEHDDQGDPACYGGQSIGLKGCRMSKRQHRGPKDFVTLLTAEFKPFDKGWRVRSHSAGWSDQGDGDEHMGPHSPVAQCAEYILAEFQFSGRTLFGSVIVMHSGQEHSSFPFVEEGELGE
jgi:hypothetical protein